MLPVAAASRSCESNWRAPGWFGGLGRRWASRLPASRIVGSAPSTRWRRGAYLSRGRLCCAPASYQDTPLVDAWSRHGRGCIAGRLGSGCDALGEVMAIPVWRFTVGWVSSRGSGIPRSTNGREKNERTVPCAGIAGVAGTTAGAHSLTINDGQSAGAAGYVVSRSRARRREASCDRDRPTGSRRFAGVLRRNHASSALRGVGTSGLTDNE